jgi:hypothetical protein
MESETCVMKISSICMVSVSSCKSLEEDRVPGWQHHPGSWADFLLLPIHYRCCSVHPLSGHCFMLLINNMDSITNIVSDVWNELVVASSVKPH